MGDRRFEGPSLLGDRHSEGPRLSEVTLPPRDEAQEGTGEDVQEVAVAKESEEKLKKAFACTAPLHFERLEQLKSMVLNLGSKVTVNQQLYLPKRRGPCLAFQQGECTKRSPRFARAMLYPSLDYHDVSYAMDDDDDESEKEGAVGGSLEFSDSTTT